MAILQLTIALLSATARAEGTSAESEDAESQRSGARAEALEAEQKVLRQAGGAPRAARPRKAFIGPRASEYRFARYVEDWRLKIERVGTATFQAVTANKSYGDLLVAVEIRADGTVDSAKIARSSGSTELDAMALRVVELAAPYAPFPPEILVDTDIISIIRTWHFAPGKDQPEPSSSSAN